MASWTSRGSLSVVGNDLLQDTTGAQPIVIAKNPCDLKNIFSMPLRIRKTGGGGQIPYSVKFLVLSSSTLKNFNHKN